MNEYKRTVLITSLLCLIPAFAGALLWNRLPASLPVHWNTAGQPDSFTSKPFAVFGVPCLILLVHLICARVTYIDPKRASVPMRILRLVLWICPVVSLIAALLTYSAAFNISIDVNMVVTVFVGLLLICIGNVLPETPPNYTIGIKLPWTLADEDNWHATHRLAGPLWILAGFLLLTTALLGLLSANLLFAILMMIIIIPWIYSARLYKKNHPE